MAEDERVRRAMERTRQIVYESGGEKAVKAAEKHLKASVPVLERNVRQSGK